MGFEPKIVHVRARQLPRLIDWVAHRLAALHSWIECVAQGVTRRRIRANECLGGALEVALAAHASTEALACGGGVFASRTCNHPFDGVAEAVGV